MDKQSLIECIAADANFIYHCLPSIAARIAMCEAEDNIREALKALHDETERDLT